MGFSAGSLAVIMKKLKIAAFTIIGILALFIVVLYYFTLGDIVTRKYNTYIEAKNSKLFARGWLPDILPKTTVNIKTINDLDINRSHGYFNIPEEDINVFISKLHKLENGEFSYSNNANKTQWLFVINLDNGHVEYKYR